jgi:hypothetical protein
MRYMKAERAISEDPSVAIKGHLRRMVELAQLVEKASLTEDPELRTMAVQYYRAEAESLVVGAKTDNFTSSPHDAAIEVAEAYLTAAFKGDVEAALKLAAPESLAASRRLLEGLKGLGDVESDGKPFSIRSVQIAARDAITVNTHVQRIDRTSNSPVTREVVVALKQANGRWLVTRFGVQAPSTPLNQRGRTPNSVRDGVPSELAIPRGNKLATPRTPKEESTPKETKVFSLKHAKAGDLQQTLSQLLELDSPDLRIAVDARTNRLLVHGTAERVEVVQALIIQLDEPSAVKESLPLPEDPNITNDPPATNRRIPEETLKPPLQQQPAGARP